LGKICQILQNNFASQKYASHYTCVAESETKQPVYILQFIATFKLNVISIFSHSLGPLLSQRTILWRWTTVICRMKTNCQNRSNTLVFNPHMFCLTRQKY